MSSFQLHAISGGQIRICQLQSPMAIGGKGSTGLSISDLKSKDDYAIVSPHPKGFQIHTLKGGVKGPVVLNPIEETTGTPLRLGDLTLYVTRSRPDTKDDSIDADVQTLMSHFSEPEDLSQPMEALVKTVTQRFNMEQGFVVVKSVGGELQVVAQAGVERHEQWIAESIVQETLQSREPKFIRNIVGTGYDRQKSLMATGFVSVFSWPLVVRGETFGALIVGSKKPHSGLSETELRHAGIFVQMSAIMLSFYLRDVQAKEEIAALRKRLDGDETPFLTSDSNLEKTCDHARRVAATDLSVLIQGQTGVGKEVLAQWIHKKSERRKGPFVPINCGAIPENLIESLLFGHRKGSFTGAHSDQVGKFQAAQGGTIFLDEVGDLPLATQVKLLRVLQERIIEPVGSNRPIPVDVRILAATHKDIPELVKQRRFREDLYYRLAEVTLTIPSLRERPNDILLLATDIKKKANIEKPFSRAAWNWMKAQPWKGNVRELMSAVKRAGVLSEGLEIEVDDLISQGASRDSAESNWLGGANLEAAKQAFIFQKVSHALSLSGGNRNGAAELLGVTPRTLFRYLEEMRSPEDSTKLTDLSANSDGPVI